jgi:nitrate reductase NapE component
LSHVSTFALLATTLMVLAVLYRGVGGFPLRRTAWSIATVTIISAVLAVALYYGHFGAVYRDALRVRAHTAAAQPSGAASSQAAPTQITSVGSRIRDAIRFAVVTIGWPIVLLAVVGIWRSIIDGARDRASLAVIAWAIACALFLGVAVMRVDAPFQRYAAEFFGRVVLATYPAAVLLAARGAAWGWHLGRPGRIASLALVCCAVAFGIQSWMTWFY